MTDLKEAVYRINRYYNSISSFGIKSVYGKNIVSDDPKKLYQNTCSNWIISVKWSGTSATIVNMDDDNETATIRYEPMVKIRTVFTGDAFENNAANHYLRIRQMLSQYSDQTLRTWPDFVDASVFFEARYLNRMQSDAVYLLYYEITVDYPLLQTIEEDLLAYVTGTIVPENFLTERNIEVSLNG